MLKVRKVLSIVFAVAALLITLDFVWPGSTFKDKILEVEMERQQYYNAARNYHYSYTVVTSQHEFSVTESFAEAELVDREIEYAVSPIFQEVNWYRLPPEVDQSYYSFRIASGLVLPLLALVVILIAFRFLKKIDMLAFILQVLLLADLVYLIL